MKITKYTSLIALFILSCYSCTKRINFDIKKNSDKLVIEAQYHAADSTVEVIIKKTKSIYSIFEDDKFISNALVNIVNDGSSVSIPSLGQGYYKLQNYIPNYSSTYKLKVEYEGKEYISTSYLNHKVDFIYNLEDLTEYPDEFGNTPKKVNVTFTDPTGSEDYYLVNPNYNNILGQGFSSLHIEELLQSDRFNDGKTFIINTGLPQPYPGDTVYIELQKINKEIHLYYKQLQQNNLEFSSVPANPYYLWTNDALGYFSAFGSHREMIIVQ